MIRNHICFSCICLCTALVLAGCTGSPGINSSLQADSLKGISVPAEHLVFIGLDGWGGAFVSKADMPTVKRMIAGGASSLDMRCIMPSISVPNWYAVFNGTPPEYRKGNITAAPGFPSIFTIAKNNNRTNALFYEWLWLEGICTAEEAEKTTIGSDRESALRAASYITEKKPAFIAVIFNEPDSTGHHTRWGTKEYYAKLAELDNFISIIEQGVKDAGIYDSTVFVLSSDHGGNFWGHGQNFKKHRQIPIVIYGRGIKNGYTIPSPLSICDIAPTMAAVMGVTIPFEWAGRALKEAFE